MLILPRRFTQQPQYAAPINWSNGILERATTVEVLLPSVTPSFGAVSQRSLPAGATPPTRDAQAAGVGAKITTSVTTGISLGAADSLLSLNKCTILVLRSLNSLTFSNRQQHGYSETGGRLAAHLPYVDGTIYWDYGDAGAGRVSVAQSWAVGAVDAFALVAGPNKGREIWRNGVRIANVASTTARTAIGANFNIGAAFTTGVGGGANDETIYQFILINDEISDARIKAWSANPWQIFQAPPRKIWAGIAAAGGGITVSSTTTDGADTFAASSSSLVSASSTTTDGTDVLVAQVGPLVVASSATTDGVDTLSASVGVTVAASSAKTDGADTLTAASSSLVSASSAITDATDTLTANSSSTVAANSVTTDSTDVFSASVTVVSAFPAFSSATTDGVDTLSAVAGSLVAASSATVDGADVVTAAAAPLVGASSATTDGADTLTANVTVVSVSVQLLGPSSDLSVGTWTPSSGTTLFGMLNESVANDATYITTNQVGTSRVALAGGGNPGVTTGHIVRYRIVGSQTVSLMQGAAVIASWSQAPVALTTYAQTLTSPQAAAITNYSALSIQFQAT